MQNKTTDWTILADGSALFFGQRAVSPEKTLDYTELCSLLQAQCGSKTPARTALYFTAADDSNEKQAKFHDVLGNMGWTVYQVPPQEASMANTLLSDQHVRIIRFDAMIAYALGRLTAKTETPQNVVIISDSWPLWGPVHDCASRGHNITIAYFGNVIDTRWHKAFRDAETAKESLTFLDLDLAHAKLFSRSRTVRRENRILKLP
jgi:hypothetical protein